LRRICIFIFQYRILHSPYLALSQILKSTFILLIPTLSLHSFRLSFRHLFAIITLLLVTAAFHSSPVVCIIGRSLKEKDYILLKSLQAAGQQSIVCASLPSTQASIYFFKKKIAKLKARKRGLLGVRAVVVGGKLTPPPHLCAADADAEHFSRRGILGRQLTRMRR
jgi:hypothetical protein